MCVCVCVSVCVCVKRFRQSRRVRAPTTKLASQPCNQLWPVNHATNLPRANDTPYSHRVPLNTEPCCLEIKEWMRPNKLKHNNQKQKVLLCEPPARRDKVPVDCLSVSDASISFSRVVKPLGVLLTSYLSFNNYLCCQGLFLS